MPHANAQKAAHLATGRAGEDKAAAFLTGLGFSIVGRNWRPPAQMAAKAASLELDIIARDGNTLVFAEVKSRTEAPGSPFKPQDAFSPAKRGRLLKAASLYLQKYGGWGAPCRFDLICVIFKTDGSVNVEHHKNVISFEPQTRSAMGGRNAPWQPW